MVGAQPLENDLHFNVLNDCVSESYLRNSLTISTDNAFGAVLFLTGMRSGFNIPYTQAHMWGRMYSLVFIQKQDINTHTNTHTP